MVCVGQSAFVVHTLGGLRVTGREHSKKGKEMRNTEVGLRARRVVTVVSRQHGGPTDSEPQLCAQPTDRDGPGRVTGRCGPGRRAAGCGCCVSV